MPTYKVTKKTLSHILLHVFRFHFLRMHRDSFFQRSLLNRKLGVLACSRAYGLAYSRAWRVCVLGVLKCLASWRAYVLACLRAYVIACLACSRVWHACVLACFVCLCIRVLCLRACYDAFLACLALAYSRFCLIIYFVCINQGFAIKRKLLIHVNLS